MQRHRRAAEVQLLGNRNHIAQQAKLRMLFSDKRRVNLFLRPTIPRLQDLQTTRTLLFAQGQPRIETSGLVPHSITGPVVAPCFQWMEGNPSIAALERHKEQAAERLGIDGPSITPGRARSGASRFKGESFGARMETVKLPGNQS